MSVSVEVEHDGHFILEPVALDVLHSDLLDFFVFGLDGFGLRSGGRDDVALGLDDGVYEFLVALVRYRPCRPGVSAEFRLRELIVDFKATARSVPFVGCGVDYDSLHSGFFESGYRLRVAFGGERGFEGDYVELTNV